MTQRELLILEFAGRPRGREGQHAEDIRELFDLSPTGYYQQLRALIRRPDAEQVDPVLVRALRARAARRGVRRIR